MFMLYLYKSNKGRINKSLSHEKLFNLFHIFYGLDLSDEDLYYNQFKKPYLKKNLYFSISHTSDVLAIIIFHSNVGIDIEKIRETDLSLISSFLTLDEINYIENSIKKSETFFKIWTCKEAYVKYLGMGLYKGFKTFTVAFKEDECYIKNDGTIRLMNFVLNYHEDKYSISIVIKK